MSDLPRDQYLDDVTGEMDEWCAVGSDLRTSWETLVDSYIARYGIPKFGRHRMVFMHGDHVYKLPRNFHGIMDNEREGSWTCEDVPLATCEVTVATPSGLPVLKMERVTEVFGQDLPAWTMSVDCAQVGYTADGRLVAFDL